MTQYVDNAFVPRATCYRCFRPRSLCYCKTLCQVHNKTRVIIVQHPRERFHPLNTARIVEHSLSRSVVIRSPPAGIPAALANENVASDAAILFPSEDAVDLEELDESQFPRQLIVIDGTWSQARNLLRDVPALRRYRCVRFAPYAPSAYRIRKEPRAEYLSTVESIAHVLRHLEPETRGVDELENAFASMIDKNIAARKPHAAEPRRRRKTRGIPHRFPEALTSASARLVVAYCEGTSRFALGSRAAPNPQATTVSNSEKEPLVIYLHRPSTGESLRLLLRTCFQVPERLLEHLAIPRAEIEQDGLSEDEARRQIDGFVQAGEMTVVWNASSMRILQEAGARLETLILKGIYCNYRTYLARREGRVLPGSWGDMDEVLSSLNVPWTRPPSEGRGLLRLSQTNALLRWIMREARVHCSSWCS